mmetsp:Transcript_30604/g.45286  ORF Transcript_30604/g.45286 Transcript_30604/m.45286 type:complete len:288 (+) Transcript_30604:107-970(+)
MAGTRNISEIAKEFKTENPDKPRRPLSAYNLFFKDERVNILNTSLSSKALKRTQECDSIDNEAKPEIILSNESVDKPENDNSPHRKISFSDLGKTIGLRWKNIDPETLDAYKRLAAADKLRYERENEVYKKKLIELRKAARKEAARKRKAEKKVAARKKCKTSEVKVVPQEGKSNSAEEDNDITQTEVISPVTSDYRSEIPLPLEVNSDGRYESLDHSPLDMQQTQSIKHPIMSAPSAILNGLSAKRMLHARALGASLGLYPSYSLPSPSQQQLLLQAHHRALAPMR